MKKSGFTIIELLVTVSIIALLSAIGFVVYRSLLQQGRDAKRQSDLKSIQSALEQYRADQGFYPSSLTFAGSSLNNCTGNPSALCTITKTYLNIIPADPTGSSQYCYQGSYELYAQLENPPSGAPSYTCNSTSYNLKVTPP